ncbi:MAG: ribonuclease III [Betaproteobacteria bacterium RIFCSPLOWO2_12_FULL_63_13]|nr:MAG: ribonuclease III [Betaproteobacteria bacterium RIFCSPLOWO2_12_FULL_63_13]
MDRGRLQQVIGYRFAQSGLLAQALTHRSYGAAHNERLEFLGDSILNCVIATELYDRFADAREGELSRLRASLVRQETLHRIAQSLCLGEQLRLGEGELKSGGHTRPSILADALEALFGAIYLDGGFEAARQIIVRLYANALHDVDAKASGKDPKTMLQELLQARHIALPTYAVVSTSGAAHDQRFVVECLIPELSVRTTGSGSSRRVAEQQAAQRACEQVRK